MKESSKVNKLLVICGPTATGKTGVALKLAKKFDGELISCDSRQVYKNTDIGTGKDIPISFKYQVSSIKYKNKRVGYYTDGKVKIWGYDLVGPKEEFSVADFAKIATLVIKRVIKTKKLPILVGGTGLYIQSVVDGIETINVPKNKSLRAILSGKSTEGLYEYLCVLAPTKSASLNHSDRNNPRRLVRAIEVAQWRLENKNKQVNFKSVKYNVLLIGLKALKVVLNNRIAKRVEKRIKLGIEGEIKALLVAGVDWHSQSMYGLGYRQMRGYVEGKLTKLEAVKDWKKQEQKYAKRQLTWFTADKRINWFDIKDIKKIDKLAEKWYSREDVGSEKD